MSLGRSARVTWTLVSLFVVETLVFGLSVLPAFLFWSWLATWAIPPEPRPLLQPTAVAMSLVPAYLVFACAFAALSAGATRIFGWRTEPDGNWRIRDLEWPVLDWVRYMVSTHLVRILVGAVFRSSPLWTWYLRWNGARIGARVYVNTLSVSDHNLLEFGDGVVIGEAVHLSGHTVEGGRVKTGRVRLAAGVTVGLNSVVGIGVEAGEKCQIGAMSVVPKYSKLEGGVVYAGVPARKLESDAASAVVET